MIVINKNGVHIHLDFSSNEISVNKQDYYLVLKLPEYITSQNISQVNGNLYVNGYEFFPNTGKWEKTLKAWWYKTF